MELKTPLYERHEALGGKIVPFAGYLLPVQFETGVIAEHMAVRQKAGLFDVSHMGELFFTGKDALANINNLFTNDFSVMNEGRVRYSPMCYDNGTVVDDLIVYKYSDEKYLAVVNAGNRLKDVDWIKSHLFGEVTFEDRSDEIAQIAIQGPLSEQILKKVCDEKFVPAKYYSFIDNCDINGVACLISRTGYTGEIGFEIYLKNADAVKIWNLLLDVGAPFGLIPCGLGARDTLRLEAGMPLYGHELSDEIDPIEAGLAFAVKLDKPDFIGKQGILSRMPITRKRVGLSVTGRGIIREHQTVYVGDAQVGETTSGTHCPYLNRPVAMAMLDVAYSELGKKVEVDVRGRRVEAEIVPLPFYQR